MFEGKTDRRSSPRFQVSLPIILKFRDPITKRILEEGTATRDASAKGIYFYSSNELKEGAEFECTLFLEPGSLQARYAATVVRVERRPESGYGVAAVTKFGSFVTESLMPT